MLYAQGIVSLGLFFLILGSSYQLGQKGYCLAYNSVKQLRSLQLELHGHLHQGFIPSSWQESCRPNFKIKNTGKGIVLYEKNKKTIYHRPHWWRARKHHSSRHSPFKSPRSFHHVFN